ncbi:hypothetical protein GXW84_33835 [Rhodococcus sp. IEGM 248]|nr:hypothetical protein [Rhodococcus sp. IEGM 248]
MVNITLDATLRVASGPTLDVGGALDLDSYSVSQLTLERAGAADKKDTAEVALLPAAKEVALLAVRVRAEDGTPGTVEMVTKNAKGEDGAKSTVVGGLVVASMGVLAALVKEGPRTLTFTNKGKAKVVVDVVAALDSPPA